MSFFSVLANRVTIIGTSSAVLVTWLTSDSCRRYILSVGIYYLRTKHNTRFVTITKYHYYSIRRGRCVGRTHARLYCGVSSRRIEKKNPNDFREFLEYHLGCLKISSHGPAGLYRIKTCIVLANSKFLWNFPFRFLTHKHPCKEFLWSTKGLVRNYRVEYLESVKTLISSSDVKF